MNKPLVINFISSGEEVYPLQIVGESFHKSSIENLLGGVDEEGTHEDYLIANLILDGNNPHDPKAVRVEIDGIVVGNLSRSDAQKYRGALAKLGLGNIVGQCYASVRGGWTKRSGEVADFGVRLDLDLNNLQIEHEKAPIAPIAPVAPVKISPSYPINGKKKFSILKASIKFLKWAFARGRWWKTILILFFGIPLLCGVLQGIIEHILGK